MQSIWLPLDICNQIGCHQIATRILITNCSNLMIKWTFNNLMATEWAFHHPMVTKLGWDYMKLKNEYWFHSYATLFPLWVLRLWLHASNHFLEPRVSWGSWNLGYVCGCFCWPFHKNLKSFNPWPFKNLVVHNNYCLEFFKFFWASYIKMMSFNQALRDNITPNH